MHMLTLRIFSKETGGLVVDQTTMVDHLKTLEQVEQSFDMVVGMVGGEEIRYTVTVQLQFDPPLVLEDDDDPAPTPE
jgi:ABC-type iron transport system FetAB ATPase subunit